MTPARILGDPGSNSQQDGAAPAAAQYVPGVCNIGSAEIARRRRAAAFGLVTTLGLAAVLVATGAPHFLRLLVAVPAAATVISALQVRDRFCVAYAARGVYNVDGPAGRATSVLDAESRSRDRRRAARTVLVGTAAGLASALVFFLIP